MSYGAFFSLAPRELCLPFNYGNTVAVNKEKKTKMSRFCPFGVLTLRWIKIGLFSQQLVLNLG